MPFRTPKRKSQPVSSEVRGWGGGWGIRPPRNLKHPTALVHSGTKQDPSKISACAAITPAARDHGWSRELDVGGGSKDGAAAHNGWIPGVDLNHDSQIQSLLSCR